MKFAEEKRIENFFLRRIAISLALEIIKGNICGKSYIIMMIKFVFNAESKIHFPLETKRYNFILELCKYLITDLIN